MIDLSNIIFVCKICGSNDVKQQAWVQLNDVNPKIDLLELCYCNMCNTYTETILKEDYERIHNK